MSNNAPAEISHKQILVSVKQELLMSDTEDHDIWLRELIDQAARRLNTTESLIVESCNVEVNDNHFQMPSNAKEIIAFRGSGSCFSGIFIDTSFFSACGCNVTSSTGFGNIFNAVNRRGRFYYFSNPIADGSEYEIAYTIVNRNCDGMMIIDEACEIALINYACWRFANTFKLTMNYDAYQINTWRKDYMDQSAKCRGNAAVRSKNQARTQINSRMNSIINLDTVSWGSLGSMLPVFWYTNNVNP